MEWFRLGVVLAAFGFFFLMISRSLSLRGSVVSGAPWSVIGDIFVFAVFGIFLIFFAFLLTRVGSEPL